MQPLLSRNKHRKQYYKRQSAIRKNQRKLEKIKAVISSEINSQSQDPFASRNPFMDSPQSGRIDRTKVNIPKHIWEE